VRVKAPCGCVYVKENITPETAYKCPECNEEFDEDEAKEVELTCPDDNKPLVKESFFTCPSCEEVAIESELVTVEQ
jgi:DNA-directed RNA polymerase subunit RPC12/RpoP